MADHWDLKCLTISENGWKRPDLSTSKRSISCGKCFHDQYQKPLLTPCRPSNGWPRDDYMKELGHWNMVNIIEGLEGFCLQLLSRGLGWERQEIDIFIAKVTTDIKDRRIHAYYPMPVVWGRKPLHA